MIARSLALAGLMLAAAGPALAQESPNIEAPQANPANAAPAPAQQAPAAQKVAPAPARPATAAAPQARRPAAPGERTAVIAVLDKRMGNTADFTLKPGERFTFGRLSGILQSCERTQPHERKQSGAFVQVTEQPPSLGNQPAGKPVLVFSGWLFAESPSLNPFVHPVYDVWLKSCTMRFPDGPPAPSATSRGNSRPMPGASPKGSASGANGGG